MRPAWVLPAAIVAAFLPAAMPARAQPADPALGTDVEGLRAAGRRLSPALRAAALDTEATAAKASGADALDDPTITDSYTYYKDPNVFSAHTVMLSQAFPLWGKRSLRRQAALADLAAGRGQERAAADQLDEGIKVAYARYFVASRDLAVNLEVLALARQLRAAAAIRYAQGAGDQLSTIQALGEETTAKLEAVRLQGERDIARAQLNALVGRPAEAPLASPMHARPMPASQPGLAALAERARAGNSALSADNAAVTAARTRSTLAEKASYPDVTVGAGPLVQTNNRPVGFSATVGLNIPLPWGREAAGRREAAAQLGASQQRYDAARREIEGALGEALAKLRAAQATQALLRREAEPQARAALRTILAGYGQGRGDLSAAVVAERQVHDIELRLLLAELDEQVEVAAIERLIGSDL